MNQGNCEEELKPLVKSTDGFISRNINRKISIRISRWIVSKNLPLAPNQATLISFIVSMVPLPLYVFKQVILAGVIVQLASIIDGIDGEIARMKNLTTKFGSFIDAMLDRIGDLAITIGACIYIFQNSEAFTVIHFVIALLAISGSLLVSYLHGRAEKDLGKHPIYFGRIPSIASRDVRLFILFVGSILNFVFEALLIIAILTFTYLSIKLVEIWKTSS